MKRLEANGLVRAAVDERAAMHEQWLERLSAEFELNVTPDLSLVTSADTDPETWRHIQQTLAHARGEFTPPPEPSSPPVIWTRA